MNDANKTKIRNRINARLSEIKEENTRGADAQAIVELDQQAIGRLSRMDALQNQAMAKAQQERRDGEFARLQPALKNVESEDYGFCEDCGEEIPLGRLLLDPAARLCVDCAAG